MEVSIFLDPVHISQEFKVDNIKCGILQIPL